MTMTAKRVAAGDGWHVEDVLCSAGPADRRFEESHGSVCIAAVTEGTFQYRSAQGTALLAPGALLLGNAGTCFECGHDHAAGDRCLSFHFAPATYERIVAEVRGARRLAFGVPRVPPLTVVAPVIAAAEAARDDRDGGALEEAALLLAGQVAALTADADPVPRVTAQDEKRVTRALRFMEVSAEEPLTLAACAEAAGLSRFHFLRTFCAVVGITPHQHVLRMRLRRAARRLRASHDSVAGIAFDCGFGDLSTFNRQFRRAAGLSPKAYRAAALR